MVTSKTTHKSQDVIFTATLKNETHWWTWKPIMLALCLCFCLWAKKTKGQNSSTGIKSWHVDTRYHFVWENVQDGIIKIEFVMSSDNNSNIFSKNVSQEIYERHGMKFLKSVEDFRSEWTFWSKKSIENISYFLSRFNLWRQFLSLLLQLWPWQEYLFQIEEERSSKEQSQ